MKITDNLAPEDLADLIVDNINYAIFPYTTKTEMIQYLNTTRYKYNQFLENYNIRTISVKGISGNPINISMVACKRDTSEVMPHYRKYYECRGMLNFFFKRGCKLSDYQQLHDQLSDEIVKLNNDSLASKEELLACF